MKIVFLLGSPDISGGTNVILEHAGGLSHLGHEVTIATREYTPPSSVAWHREAQSVAWNTIDDLAGQEYNFAIATWWQSPYLLEKIKATHYVYFVQSIESTFFPEEDPQNHDTRDHSVGVCRCSNSYFFSLPVVTEATWIQQYLEKHYNHKPYLVRNGIRKDIYENNVVITERNSTLLRVLVEGPVDVFHKNVPRSIELCKQAGVDEVWLLTSSDIDSFPGVDRLFSRIPFDQTPQVYRSCHVLLKLSYIEGMFGPPLEMFHCGGTALVYNVTGHDEYMQHRINGLVVEKDDEAEVVSYLRELKNNSRFLSDLCAEALKTAQEWPDWQIATQQFATTLEEISKSSPISRAYLANITDTFNTYQALQIQSRELDRFAQREGEANKTNDANDNFVQLYFQATSSENLLCSWAHYRCGKRVDVTISAGITGNQIKLRIDPSVRIGIIQLYAIQIKNSNNGQTIIDFNPANGFEKLYLTGTAKWIKRNKKYWVMESFGNDPQLYLPTIENPNDSGKFFITLSLKEMGISDYITEIEEKNSKISPLRKVAQKCKILLFNFKTSLFI